MTCMNIQHCQLLVLQSRQRGAQRQQREILFHWMCFVSMNSIHVIINTIVNSAAVVLISLRGLGQPRSGWWETTSFVFHWRQPWLNQLLFTGALETPVHTGQDCFLSLQRSTVCVSWWREKNSLWGSWNHPMSLCVTLDGLVFLLPQTLPPFSFSVWFTRTYFLSAASHFAEGGAFSLTCCTLCGSFAFGFTYGDFVLICFLATN